MKSVSLIIMFVSILGCFGCSCKSNKESGDSGKQNIINSPEGEDRLLQLHLSYVRWHNKQLIAEDILQPFSRYRSRIIDEERSFSFTRVLREQKRLVESIERKGKLQNHELEDALRKWLLCQIDTTNIQKRLLKDEEISVESKYDPTAILDIQRVYGETLERENQRLNKLELSRMQEIRKKRGMAPM